MVSAGGAACVSAIRVGARWSACAMALSIALSVLLGTQMAATSPALLDLQELQDVDMRDSSPAPRLHHLTKRSFFNIQCKGVYDKSIFARLDRICEDCYNLFREPQLHSLCR